MLAVGKFPWLPAAESSIRMSRISAVTASDRVIYADTSKKEATWCKVLGHCYAKYDSTLRVFKGWWDGRYFARIVRNRNGNLNTPYLYENDDKVVLNWNWADNDWNDNNPALRLATYFILISHGNSKGLQKRIESIVEKGKKESNNK